ncbi:MAG: hypothetical protein ACRYFZ_06845 [Janthinobacterium lividum]
MTNSTFPEHPQTAYRTVTQVLDKQAYSPWEDWRANSCWLAALMQAKDTANILLMLADGTLLFGIFFGIGIPGLILYVLRWRQVRRRVGRGSILVLAALSLAHEVFWAYFFQHDITSIEPVEHAKVLSLLYMLGAVLTGVQLLAVALTPAPDAEELAGPEPVGQTEEE